MSAGFVHLHVHSDYSILDGACKINELLDRCEKFGMNACGLTDHGNLFGAIEFYKAAKKRGIKPIVGCEVYLAPEARQDTQARFLGSLNNHFLLLCENEVGYHNLCKLSSLGYLEGFYYKPRVDMELLKKYSEGLIATTSCLAGRVPQALMNDNLDLANEQLKGFIDIFGKDNFLVELMDHGLPEQKHVNPFLAEMAEHHKLMTIATNDCHYIDRSDAEAHDALLCIQTGSAIEDENRFRFQNDSFYFCSPDEMREKFPEWPEAVANTEKIAERCSLDIPLGESLIPKYDVPEGFTPSSYLEKLVFDGLEERYSPVPEEYIERARFELDVIERMKFVDYFLVVWDLIHYARRVGIPVGPGRGSGAGSIVAYSLYITNIDPMRYHLLFERFLNPERISMPDFDIDFCFNRREEMIEYTYDKYGHDNVAQIITFGKMLAKNVVRNVGRVMGMAYGEVDRIAKLIPDELKISLSDALNKEPELNKIIASDPQVAKLWRLAERLEGTIGNCGTHAAGVVICDHALTDHVALFKAPNSETVATQAEMKCVEEVGLLKMDFLGLRTLTVVHEAVRLIRETRGIEISIDDLEPDDETTYEVLRSGQTTGIFQLESAGMRDLARRIGLQSLEEMSALVALYRPGPMQFIDTYIENKFNPEKVTYDHPLLEEILKETYGIAVYQEQVMQMVQACGGFSLGQADIVRRAMGKKDRKLLDEQKAKFIAGCKEKDIDQKLAMVIWDKIETFAGYGFNKSHSVAYAFVAYQTAYLKANYPVEFMCALLTSESGNLEKTAMYVEECRRMGIDVLPPDANHSCVQFMVEGPSIRFALTAIKNVGDAPAAALVAERDENGPFTDIFDICARLDTKSVNRRLLESLNRCGGMASTGWNRRQVEQVLDDALAEGQSAARDRASGQFSLFDMEGMEDSVAEMRQKPELIEWPDIELLQMEKEMLGLYISSHPLAPHADALKRFVTATSDNLREFKDGEEAIVGGLLTQVKIHITSKNAKMAFISLESLTDSLEVTVFADLYEKASGLLTADSAVFFICRVNYRNGEPGLVASDVMPADEAESRLARAVHVRMDTAGLSDSFASEIAGRIGDRRGECDVYLHCMLSTGEEVVIHATEASSTAATPGLKRSLVELVGEGNVWFTAGREYPSHRKPNIVAPDVPRWKKRAAG